MNWFIIVGSLLIPLVTIITTYGREEVDESTGQSRRNKLQESNSNELAVTERAERQREKEKDANETQAKEEATVRE